MKKTLLTDTIPEEAFNIPTTQLQVNEKIPILETPKVFHPKIQGTQNPKKH